MAGLGAGGALTPDAAVVGLVDEGATEGTAFVDAGSAGWDPDNDEITRLPVLADAVAGEVV